MVRAFVASVLVVSLMALAPYVAAQEKTVHFYNWSDYIDPAMLEEFTKETGIKVVYHTYDNIKIAEAKLRAGRSGYDVVVPSTPSLQRLIKAGLFAKLDKAKIPNLRHSSLEVAGHIEIFDPGNEHGVIYMWGTTGIGINVDMVKERLGDQPLDTWDLVLKPELAAKLKDCGIQTIDAPEDVFPGVLNYLKLNPDSKHEQDLEKAADALLKVRGNIQKFHSSEYINALANGDICVAVGYSGDVLQARARAEWAKIDVDIAYILPKEGAQMWFDSMAIPADAPHKDEAHAFINFMMRPEVAAANTNYVSFANGNAAAKPFINPKVLSNPAIYPDEATMKRLFTNTTYEEPFQQALARLWTRVKTGN